MKNLKRKNKNSEDDSLTDTLVIKNSFSRIVNFPEDVRAAVDQILTYQNDIEAEKVQLMKEIKYFKQFIDSDNETLAAKSRQRWGFAKKKLKDLLASEFVHWLDGDRFPTGHLNIVQDVLSVVYPKYKTIDYRVKPERQHRFVLREPLPEPRYYQSEMHELGIEHGRGVFEAAVGTGKSLVLMRLLYEFGVTSLIVVPSKPLMNQLEKGLVQYFGERNVMTIGAKDLTSTAKIRKMKKCPIRLINIQSFASLNKKGTVSDLVEDVNAIFIDEVHHSGSKSYTDLLDALDHIYYRFGFTGTFLRNDSKTLDMWGFLSNRLYHYPAWKATSEGYLTPISVNVHKIRGIKKGKYQSEYNANYCGGQELLDRIKQILDEQVKLGQQVLILVNRKDKAGLVIHEFLEEEGYENTYISGDDDKDAIDEALSDFNAKKIGILIGSSVIGEGIDIRSTDHLIMAQGGKSEIAIVQAVGRLVRLYENKKSGVLHDFQFEGTKYMEKHLKTRLQIYERNFQPKKIKAG